MTVGQAYSDALSKSEQKALESACDILIDEVFEDLESVKNPGDLVNTTLEDCLPRRYLYRYTPPFLKQFVVCIITVAWKLAQPEHMPLSSLAEELAAWAIVRKAQALMEEDAGKRRVNDPFDTFIDVYFEDLDFQFLFDDFYDGIDQEPVLAQTLGISSLSLEDWFKSFSDEPSRIPHPYVV